MKHVIRRSRILFAALAATLVLSACAGGDEVWLQQGDVTVTQGELTAFADAQSDGDPLRRLSADAVRAFFRNMIIDNAGVTHLESLGITPTAADLTPFVQAASGQGAVDPDSNLVQVLARGDWAFSIESPLVEPVLGADGRPIVDQQGNPQLDLTEEGRAAVASIGEVHLSSRVGVWDNVSQEVLPPIIACN